MNSFQISALIYSKHLCVPSIVLEPSVDREVKRNDWGCGRLENNQVLYEGKARKQLSHFFSMRSHLLAT